VYVACSTYNTHSHKPEADFSVTHGHQFVVRVAERLFCKVWREERIVFVRGLNTGLVQTERVNGTGRESGGQGSALSQWMLRIPGHPDLSCGCHVVQFMALGSRRRDKVHCLLAQSGEEVK